MLKEGKIYRLTEEGRKAWESQDVAIPAEYRRILWLIETEAHVDVVRGCLREYPDELLDEWLGELEELDLLRSKQTVVEYDLDLSVADAKARALVEEDTVRLDRDALEIGSRLAREILAFCLLLRGMEVRKSSNGRQKRRSGVNVRPEWTVRRTGRSPSRIVSCGSARQPVRRSASTASARRAATSPGKLPRKVFSMPVLSAASIAPDSL